VIPLVAERVFRIGSKIILGNSSPDFLGETTAVNIDGIQVTANIGMRKRFKE
jgi:hypothetical protein